MAAADVIVIYYRNVFAHNKFNPRIFFEGRRLFVAEVRHHVQHHPLRGRLRGVVVAARSGAYAHLGPTPV